MGSQASKGEIEGAAVAPADVAAVKTNGPGNTPPAPRPTAQTRSLHPSAPSHIKWLHLSVGTRGARQVGASPAPARARVIPLPPLTHPPPKLNKFVVFHILFFF